MMGEKKDFKVQTFEDLISVCVPPEKVREEIKRNFLMANISILRIFKTLSVLITGESLWPYSQLTFSDLDENS